MEIWCHDGSLIVNTSHLIHSMRGDYFQRWMNTHLLIQWVFQARRQCMCDWIATLKPQQFKINQLVNHYFDEQWIISKQKCKIFAGSTFLDVRICFFSLPVRLVHEEFWGFGQKVWEKKQSEGVTLTYGRLRWAFFTMVWHFPDYNLK